MVVCFNGGCYPRIQTDPAGSASNPELYPALGLWTRGKTHRARAGRESESDRPAPPPPTPPGNRRQPDDER